MALITKEDIENELQIELGAGYNAAMMDNIIDTADDMLKMKTSRATFTGSTANLAKYAEICLAIDRLILSNRDLVKTAIDSISENGASIKFSNGKTLASYRAEANAIIADLRLPGSRASAIVFSDPSDSHTGTEGSILY